ncbi:pimeloyl-ACP methyl ester carboxylesterase [Chitinivorax tropicus]|uniref:Pimeloyl-ACP methyl ester carboxylesterase n=1 Tax=Chitinivorax tropicus TaxID=714531 RepID=A0A840MT27_9PROT|nr:alpha/beta fold hydrolase [Chitinivorax tropicus]MBB5020357.1 pimeloyl-ACP methyl ester carboxylesterase [Chitinivorax tropicus]
MIRRFLITLAALSFTLLGGGCSSEQAVQTAIQFERKLSHLERKQVTIDGHTVFYQEGGAGDTILMLHGFGADADNWTRFARPITGQYHVIAPDLPGSGESSRLQQANYSIPSQAQRVLALLDALKIDKAHLVGNSMGGYIAAWFAANHPERVRSLALFDNAGVLGPHLSPFYQSLQNGRNRLVVAHPAQFDDLWQLVFANPPYLPGFAKQYLADKAYQHRDFNQKIFNEVREPYLPLEPLLPKIVAPTLIVWGEADQVLDISSIAVMKTHLTHTQPEVVTLPGVGHLPMVEQPKQTARIYLDFIQRIRG